MSRCNEQNINVNKYKHTPGSPSGIRGDMNNHGEQHLHECNYMYRVQLLQMSGLPPLKFVIIHVCRVGVLSLDAKSCA